MTEEIDISSELDRFEETRVGLMEINNFIRDEDIAPAVRLLARDVNSRVLALKGKLKSIEKKCEGDADFYVMNFVFPYDSDVTFDYLFETFKILHPKLQIFTARGLVEGFKGTTQLCLAVTLPLNEGEFETRLRSDKPVVLRVISSSVIMNEDDQRTISKVHGIIAMTGGILKSFTRFDEGTALAYELKFGWKEGWMVDREEIVDRIIGLPGLKTMTPVDIRGAYDPFTGKTNGIMTITVSSNPKWNVSDDVGFGRSSFAPPADEMKTPIEPTNKRKREEEEEEEEEGEEEKLESNSTETRKTKRKKKNRKSEHDDSVDSTESKTVEICTVDGKIYKVPFEIINANCSLFRDCATYGEWDTKGMPKEGFSVGILSGNFERLYSVIRYSVFPDDGFFASDQEKRELEDDCAFYGVEYKKVPKTRFNPIPEEARDTNNGSVYFCVSCDRIVEGLHQLDSICLQCSYRPSPEGSNANRLFGGISQLPKSLHCPCIKQVRICHPCFKIIGCAIQKRWLTELEPVSRKTSQIQ
jgi:hypothetical protein